MMLLSSQIGAFSAQEFNKYLFGDVFGNVVNTLLLLVLFGVTSVMLSGAGAVFEEQLRLPETTWYFHHGHRLSHYWEPGITRCF